MFLLWLKQLPQCGDQTPASVPPPIKVRSSPTNSPLVPSSYCFLHGSVCSFPKVKYSCPLSARVPLAFLCVKVYFWCICGERCTPHSPTPPPFCFTPAQFNFLMLIYCYYISQTFLNILTSRWYPLSFLFLQKRNQARIYILLIIIMRMVEQPGKPEYTLLILVRNLFCPCTVHARLY